jgi:hypothetical protein
MAEPTITRSYPGNQKFDIDTTFGLDDLEVSKKCRSSACLSMYDRFLRFRGFDGPAQVSHAEITASNLVEAAPIKRRGTIRNTLERIVLLDTGLPVIRDDLPKRYAKKAHDVRQTISILMDKNVEQWTREEVKQHRKLYQEELSKWKEKIKEGAKQRQILQLDQYGDGHISGRIRKQQICMPEISPMCTHAEPESDLNSMDENDTRISDCGILSLREKHSVVQEVELKHNIGLQKIVASASKVWRKVTGDIRATTKYCCGRVEK